MKARPAFQPEGQQVTDCLRFDTRALIKIGHMRETPSILEYPSR